MAGAGRAQWAVRQVPGHSLAAFRSAFGLILFWATLRFFVNDWIDELYVRPSFHFTYLGFGFVRPWPAPFIHWHFALMGVAALCVALGLFYRVAIISFFFLFAYVELLDVTTYLNHYYAVLLFAGLLCFLPAARVWSLDHFRRTRRSAAAPREETVAFISIFVLRAQLGIVYFFAGLAKLNRDWLVEARPLGLWLQALSDRPWVAALLSVPGTPHLMSWAGAFFDLTIPLWLAWPRTRRFGYVAVLAFHVVTAALFPIGIFPWLMMGLTPIFFDPAWPLALLQRPIPASRPGPRQLARHTWLALIVWWSVQSLLPLRHHLYPGDVLQTEQGFRWSWHVMIVERQGLVTFRVVDEAGRTESVKPANELSPLQARMMATQPDLILQYAHHLRDQRAAAGHRVQVFADAFVSTNGHPSRRLIDPRVDLAREQDTVWGYGWVLSGPP